MTGMDVGDFLFFTYILIGIFALDFGLECLGRRWWKRMGK